jgi:hypothetical protein
MPSVNPGPATTQTPNQVAQLLPVNTLQKPVEVGTNALRLLAVARNINLSQLGDAAVMPVINSTQYAPVNYVFANGQVNGVPGSIATAAVGIFQAPAAGGSNAIRAANTALSTNSAAGSSISTAAAVVNLTYTSQLLYLNVGTVLAGATVDLFIYGYDQT